MPKSHEDLICWQLADKLRQLIANLRWLKSLDRLDPM
jgi:hypothetical protein